MTWDVIIYDTKSAPFTSRMVREQPIGSTELCLAQLAEQIANRGHRVLVYCNTPTQSEYRVSAEDVGRWPLLGFVAYWPHTMLESQQCRSLILSRDTPRPPGIRADRVVVYGSDNARFGEPGADVYVAVSPWHARTSPYPERTIVIPPMIADEVYELRSTPKVPGRYIAASAWNKGGDLMLIHWHLLREQLPGAHLVVTTGGYDEPSEFARSVAGWEWLGLMPPRRIAEEIARSEALFYVGKDPETFGGTAAIAEAVGCIPYVLCTGDPGALPDTLTWPVFTQADAFHKQVIAMNKAHREGLTRAPTEYEPIGKDYRVSTWMPRWLEVLGLT